MNTIGPWRRRLSPCQLSEQKWPKDKVSFKADVFLREITVTDTAELKLFSPLPSLSTHSQNNMVKLFELQVVPHLYFTFFFFFTTKYRK